MARRPKPGKCVHCLRNPVERNWDHVFPESWYPASTKQNEKKWQVPSCFACNNEYGKLESDLLIRLGLCLEPYDEASAGIVQKVKRALDPKAARNPRDRKFREARLRKMLSEIQLGDAIPRDATIPGMEDRWGTSRPQQTGIPIPVESLQRLIEKIVRGIFYVEDGRFIEPPFKRIYKREPGIVVHRAVVEDDKHSSIFEMVFWNQFKMHATVTNGGFKPEDVRMNKRGPGGGSHTQ